jgi:hypothetical protein
MRAMPCELWLKWLVYAVSPFKSKKFSSKSHEYGLRISKQISQNLLLLPSADGNVAEALGPALQLGKQACFQIFTASIAVAFVWPIDSGWHYCGSSWQ